MSVASEGIWFPIANNNHLHNPINDQPADDIQATINKHETLSGKSVGKQFPIANDHHLHNPINDQPADSIPPIIDHHETSSGKPTVNRQASIYPTYGSPFGSQAKANLVDGYTQLVTDRVRVGWSCHLVTILFSQLPGTRSTIIGYMRDEVQRLYSTLLTRVHRKPRTASTDELPVLIGVMDLPVHKRDRASGPMVNCNGGLHVHAPMLIPPASRLKESLADHFRDKRELYAGSGRSVQRIHVEPVVGDHERVVDYVLKTVLNGRLTYDEAVLVLPRSRGELETQH
jgi:hypothetical protein